MKTYSLFIITFVLSILLQPNLTSAQWVQIKGLQGGTITALMVNNSTIIAGIRDSSVFISNDDGTTWKSLDSIVGLSKGDDSVTSFTQLGNSIFIGIKRYPFSTPPCVYRSQNNGKTWGACSFNIPVYSFLKKNDTIFAGTTSGVYFSADTGKSWIEANSGFPVNTTVYTLASCGNTLIAGTNNGMYSSTDDGTGWFTIDSELKNDTAFTLVPKGDTLFAGTNSGIYRSADNGLTWMNCTTGSSLTLRITSIALSGGSIFAGGKDCGLFISTNDGMDWTNVNTGLSRTPVSCITKNGTAVFIGTDGAGILVTKDNGTTWTSASPGLPFKSQINSVHSSGNYLFIGTPAGIFRSADNGDNWTPVNNGLPADNLKYSISSIDNTILTGTDGYGIYCSTTNGSSWSPVNNGLTNKHITSLITNNNYIFTGTIGGIFTSNGADFTWSLLNNGLMDSTVLFLAAGNSRLFALMQHYYGSIIYYSTDNGSNWMPATEFKNSGSGSTLITSFAANNDDLLIGTYTSMKVRDIGTGISYSTDNGASFTKANTGLPSEVFVYDIVTTQKNIFIVTSSGVYTTSKHSFNWVPQNEGFPQIVPDVIMTSFSKNNLTVNESYLFASINKKGLWRMPLSAVKVKSNKNYSPDQFALKSIKSNQLKSNIEISFILSRPDKVTIKIYNLSGCEIGTLMSNKALGSGLHNLSLHTNNIPNGCYTMKMQIGTKTVSKLFQYCGNSQLF